ncbi:hypothetical protein A2999_02320 [Candidatus Wolfebacteria bacterium RIFCSPLOWO2_01_FULL_38_11]|uniref:NLP/P60 protein n=2 Tax=Candidatus Wolfeibacteriota TaxID=1752735 RepID=A0A0G0IFL7_9BACT|nr:MAG: NLP/P60 protein [Candidatus Wolfebacteria bacterium GW2011_GWC1_37_10]OGM91821.1 MAG: hypothetical protein A2999_02320 [Candidatus Wolfebacteria bacterium RIFCSPLOWO2_01_FULL_38_11]
MIRQIFIDRNKAIIFLPILFFLAFGLFFYLNISNSGILAATPEEDAEKRKVLQEELEKYEKQIDEYESTIADLKKEGKTLNSEISKLNAKIAKINLQVKAATLNLQRLDGEIKDTEAKISATEGDINFNKKALSEALQNIYESERRGLLEVVLANPKLSDFFGDINNLLEVQENLRQTLDKIVALRDQLVDEKENLALERSDAVELKDYQDVQKASAQKTQSDKSNLLKITKGKESEYQKILTETKKSAAEIRKQIFKMLGGGELDFEKAYELAKSAEKATGVRAALILAVLSRESALGKNVGQCNYKTAMHPKRDIPIFMAIVKDLNLTRDLESGILKVSCPIVSDGAYGGAMGPAQFIPSTWGLYAGYRNNEGWLRDSSKDRIGEITGSNPPSPWSNVDAFVATALYLKDAGATTNERIAAAKYYCGGKWNRYVCTNVYGKKVVEQAKKFQDDIDILSS